MSQLLPEGIDGLADCPYTLHEAIAVMLRILSYEDLPIEERPPKHTWLDGDKLAEWWEKVESDRRAKYGLPSDENADGEYEDNAAALELIKRG